MAEDEEYLENREHRANPVLDRLKITPIVKQALAQGKLDTGMTLQQQKNQITAMQAVDTPVVPDECVRNLRTAQPIQLPKRG